ncbi:MAG: hypothetical protein ACE5F1_19475, partial [Planctomycetota bacterium]
MSSGLMRPANGGDLGPLFDNIRTPARTTDPGTSHEAARHLKQGGQLTAQAQATLEALREWLELWGSPPTSHELAGTDLKLRYLYARRLPDLEAAGLVVRDSSRTCRITSRRAMTWRTA